MNQDEEHLKLLSTFHYVVGGLAGLFACFPILHIVLGLAMLFGAIDDGGKPPPEFVGWMFVVMGGFFMLGGWAIAICLLLAGGYLKRRAHYTFCLVIAGISCLFMPFGTILGVFTIIVLTRPAVKEMFGVKESTGTTP